MHLSNAVTWFASIVVFFFAACDTKKVLDGESEIDCQFVTEDLRIPVTSYGDSERTLAAIVRRPSNKECQLPTVLLQTPYNRESARDLWLEDTTNNPLFASKNYAFVIVDRAGFFGSKDAAVSDGMPAPDGEDGNDIINWIGQQSWSNRKVGMWGPSALCQIQYQVMAGTQRDGVAPQNTSPYLTAAIPIFCAPQNYTQFYPGNVLRDEWVFTLSGLGFPVLANTLLNTSSESPAWEILENNIQLERIGVPTLNITGWWDLNTGAAIQTFSRLRQALPQDSADRHRLLVGPWFHFATGGEGLEAIGEKLDDQESLFSDKMKQIQHHSLAFFDVYLRDIENNASSWQAVRIQKTPTAEWEPLPSWPPPTNETKLYLTSSSTLAPQADPNATLMPYYYDPNNPSRTEGGRGIWPGIPPNPAFGTKRLRYGPRDQESVLNHLAQQIDGLPQGRVWQSAPLSEPLQIAGIARAQLTVRTDAPDTDFSIRLVDILPNGTHLLLASGIQRLRDQIEDPIALSFKSYTISISALDDLAYTFAAGHRIGLIVTSSNYPRFARHPNTFNQLLPGITYATNFFPETYYLSSLCPRGPGVGLCNALLLGDSATDRSRLYQSIENTSVQTAKNSIEIGSSALILPVRP